MAFLSHMLDWNAYTILIVVLIVITLKRVVSAVGKSTIQDHVWTLYSREAHRLGLGQGFRQYAATRAELALVNSQKRSISAQDQYAKWTKLQRKVDALQARLKEDEQAIAGSKETVSKAVSVALICATTVPIWIFRLWFRKLVLMYLPVGVFPRPLEWILALPFMKTGAVGLTVWMFSVGSVLAAIFDLGSFVLYTKTPAKPVLVSAKENN